MIGLEYICNLYNKSYNSVAEELGISRQSINNWLKELRPISQKHLPKLSEIFELPEEYFQKELTDEEKDIVKKKKIDFEIEKIVDLIMNIDADKELMENKTTEEQIDYVETMYYGVIDTIQYIINKKTLSKQCEEIKKELNLEKKEQETEMKEILEVVKEKMFKVDINLKEFKEYIENY